jgi:hypothetical protein
VQGGQDIVFNVPAPVLDKIIEFLLRRNLFVFLSDAADFVSQGRIGWFAQPDRRNAFSVK